MKLLALTSVLFGFAASVLGQTIEIGTPVDGDVLWPGQNFTSRIILPISMSACIQVGIALAVANCNNGVCPDPSQRLENVLYAGPWTPTLHTPGGYYEDFNLLVPSYVPAGPAIFTLTHLCLLGAAPFPLLEFRNVSVTIG